MHGDVHAANKVNRQINDDPLIPVLAYQHDAIAGLDAEPLECQCRAPHIVSQFAPRQCAETADAVGQIHPRSMRVLADARAEDGNQVFPRRIHRQATNEIRVYVAQTQPIVRFTAAMGNSHDDNLCIHDPVNNDVPKYI